MDEKKMKEVFERALKTDPAQIGHYVQGGYMSPEINPVNMDLKVIGPAFTIRLPSSDNTMYYYALQKAPKGSVIVIDRMGEHRVACIGGVAALCAKELGMAGIIVDGPSTDTREIMELNFPVFSTGRSAVTNTLKGVDGEYNIPIQCGGAVVNPGDIVYGDVDGVVVIPADKFESYVNKAEAADQEEVILKEIIKNGGYVTKFWNINKLAEEGIADKVAEKLKVN